MIRRGSRPVKPRQRPVVSQFDAAELFGRISYESASGTSVAAPDSPRGHHRGIGIERYPRPHVPVTKLARVSLRDVLSLGIDKAPDLVTLNPLRLEVP